MNRLFANAKPIALLCLSVFLLTASGVLVNSCHNLRPALQNLTATTGNTKELTGKVNAYVTPDVLRDLHNDVTASVGTGQITANAYAEVAKSSTSLLDRHAAPMIDAMRAKFNATMDVLLARGDENLGILADNQRKLGVTITSVTRLVDGLSATATKFGITVDEVNDAVKMASEKLGCSLDALYNLIGSPEWYAMLQNLNGSTANVQMMTANGVTITGNAATASAQMPSIATSLEKIAKTSSKFARVTLTANVIATLARAFIP